MNRIYGLTLTEIETLPDTILILKSIPRRTTVRLVCDPGMGPKYYEPACEALFPLADIVLQPVDSSSMEHYNLASYRARFTKFLAALGKYAAYCEIGNEVNGDWLGRGVFQKLKAAQDVANLANVKSLLTMFYDGDNPAQMRGWLAEHPMPHVDVAGLSFYPRSSSTPPSLDSAMEDMQSMFADSVKWISEYGSQDGAGNLGTPEQETSLIRQLETYVPPATVKNYAGCIEWNALDRWTDVAWTYAEVWK